MFFLLEILGTVAFAISGAMTGVRKKMDVLGVAVLGMTTAVGGGIIRDIIIDMTPPTAFREPVYALVSLFVSLIVFVPKIRARIHSDARILTLADALGLGVFTVIGVEAGSHFNNVFLSIFLGTVTGVGGGVLRDVFAMETPVIFVRHFYAAAAICGAAVCALLYPIDPNLAMLSGFVLVVVLRLLAAHYKWQLPKA